MHGYSDRINHAFAFAAKHYATSAPAHAGPGYLAHPSNVAVILARYGADETTLVAGILHHVLEAAEPGRRTDLERKVSAKFGPVALAVALDAIEPRFDVRGLERPWQGCKQEFLAHVVTAEPRALDIIVADELQQCGATIATLRRLGLEYMRALARATSSQMLWWHRSLLEVLGTREDWPHRHMLDELRLLSAELVRSLRANEDDR